MTDNLDPLMAAVSFTKIETDLVAIAAASAVFYLAITGILWVWDLVNIQEQSSYDHEGYKWEDNYDE